jgi:hypothetical protein
MSARWRRLKAARDAEAEAKAEAAAPARIIARGGGYEFWLHRGEVYRCAAGGVMDIYGLPANNRWECKIAHFRHYRRSVYDWVVDVEEAP